MHSGVVDSFIDTSEMAKRLNIVNRLIITTRLSGPQQVSIERLNAIYNSSDVGINTSLGEGWGLCLEENTPIWTREGIMKTIKFETDKNIKPKLSSLTTDEIGIGIKRTKNILYSHHKK